MSNSVKMFGLKEMFGKVGDRVNQSKAMKSWLLEAGTTYEVIVQDEERVITAGMMNATPNATKPNWVPRKCHAVTLRNSNTSEETLFPVDKLFNIMTATSNSVDVIEEGVKNANTPYECFVKDGDKHETLLHKIHEVIESTGAVVTDKWEDNVEILRHILPTSFTISHVLVEGMPVGATAKNADAYAGMMSIIGNDLGVPADEMTLQTLLDNEITHVPMARIQGARRQPRRLMIGTVDQTWLDAVKSGVVNTEGSATVVDDTENAAETADVADVADTADAEPKQLTAAEKKAAAKAAKAAEAAAANA